MSIYTLNRYTVANAGGGLPFYKEVRYQHRFLEIPPQNALGYMQCPNNRFPTFQFKFQSTLAAFNIIKLKKVVGQKVVATYTAPATTGAFFEICLDGTAERFFFTKDIVLPFAFPSGLYYFEFKDGLKFLYSEVFQLGGNFGCVDPTINTGVITNGPTGTVEIVVGVLTTSGLTVLGTPQLFTPSNPLGVDYTSIVNEDIISGNSIEIRVETNTVEYGLFKSYFDVGYTNPDQVTITPKGV